MQAPVSAASRDALFYDSPDTFDYLRFYKQRLNAAIKGSEAGNQGQVVGVGLDNLTWGFGKHACVGIWQSHMALSVFVSLTCCVHRQVLCDQRNEDNCERTVDEIRDEECQRFYREVSKYYPWKFRK